MKGGQSLFMGSGARQRMNYWCESSSWFAGLRAAGAEESKSGFANGILKDGDPGVCTLAPSSRDVVRRSSAGIIHDLFVG
jgi:hypothetical protein